MSLLLSVKSIKERTIFYARDARKKNLSRKRMDQLSQKGRKGKEGGKEGRRRKEGAREKAMKSAKVFPTCGAASRAATACLPASLPPSLPSPTVLCEKYGANFGVFPFCPEKRNDEMHSSVEQPGIKVFALPRTHSQFLPLSYFPRFLLVVNLSLFTCGEATQVYKSSYLLSFFVAKAPVKLKGGMIG